MTLALFLHLLGIVVWIGAGITISVLLLSILKLNASESRNQVLTGILKKSYMLIHPAATIVLGSGLYMLITADYAQKPFWVTLMQHGGTLAVILSLVVGSILSGKAIKQLAQSDSNPSMLKTYVWVTYVSVILSLVILYFVAAKPV